jgi:hypothetical protein
VSRGAPVDALDATGRTALAKALADGSLGEARTLLARGADPKLRDRHGINIALWRLTQSARSKFPKDSTDLAAGLELMASHGVRLDDFAVGRSVLTYARSFEAQEGFKKLGATWGERSALCTGGLDDLERAIRYDDLVHLEGVLNDGLPLGGDTQIQLIELARDWQREAMVERLLGHGSAVLDPTELLVIAGAPGQKDIALARQALMDGADPNAARSDGPRREPLFFTTCNELLDLLVEHGAQLLRPNSVGLNIVDWAIAERHFSVLERLAPLFDGPLENHVVNGRTLQAFRYRGSLHEHRCVGWLMRHNRLFHPKAADTYLRGTNHLEQLAPATYPAQPLLLHQTSQPFCT